MNPLYEITAQHRALQLLTDETDIDPQVLTDTLEGLTGDFEGKAKSVAMFIKNLQADSFAIREAADAMYFRAERLKKRAEDVKEYLLRNMEACQITKISCPYFVIALRKNPPRVDILDEAAIPDTYRVWPEPPPPAIDKRALLDALKKGAKVEGAAISQGTRVEISV